MRLYLCAGSTPPCTHSISRDPPARPPPIVAPHSVGNLNGCIMYLLLYLVRNYFAERNDFQPVSDYLRNSMRLIYRRYLLRFRYNFIILHCCFGFWFFFFSWEPKVSRRSIGCRSCSHWNLDDDRLERNVDTSLLKDQSAFL